jgi:hypothetical protein
MYTPPFQEWYHRVALPNRVKVPTELTKFSGQDGTSTVEHIAHYLMQLGEASADEAFRFRYFPLSMTGPAFIWFTSLPAHSICSWNDLEQKFHAHYYTGSNEKKLIDLTTLRQRYNETPMEFLKRFKRDKKHVLLSEHTGWSIAWYGCSRDVASHSGGAIRDGIR